MIGSAALPDLRGEHLRELRAGLATPSHRPYLVTVPPIFNQMANLATLDHLIREGHERGIYAAVYRPHQFMRRLLDVGRIPTDGLVFVDAVHLLADPRPLRPAPAGTVVVPAPFQDGFLTTLRETIHRVRPEFLVIDNIVGMLAFVPTPAILRAVLGAREALAESGGTRFIIFADSPRNDIMSVPGIVVELVEELRKTGVEEIQL